MWLLLQGRGRGLGLFGGRRVGGLLVLVLFSSLLTVSVAASEPGSGSGLVLADFDVSGLEVELAGLVVAGSSGSQRALFAAEGSRWAVSGSLVDGELGLGAGESPVVRIMSINSGAVLRLNDAGPLVLRDYFGASGEGADLTVHIETADGEASFAVAGNVRSAGSGYVNFDVPTEARSVLNSISDGDRFILALTRPAAQSALAQDIEPVEESTVDSVVDSVVESAVESVEEIVEESAEESVEEPVVEEIVVDDSVWVGSGSVTFGESSSVRGSAVAYSRMGGVGSVVDVVVNGTEVDPWLNLFAVGQYKSPITGGPAVGLTDPVLLTFSPLPEIRQGFWLQLGDVLLNSADAVVPEGAGSGFKYWLWDAPCANFAVGDTVEMHIWAGGEVPALTDVYTDATLASLDVTGAALDAMFNPAVADHAGTVDAATDQVTIDAVPNSTHACGVDITPADVDPDTAGHQINIGDDPALVTVTVTAADQTTTSNYTMLIGHGGPTPAYAKTLTLDGVDDFGFEPDTRRYDAPAPVGARTTTVNAAGLGDTTLETFSLTAGNTQLTPTGADGVVGLFPGRDTLIALRATAPDYEQQAFYTVRLQSPQTSLVTNNDPNGWDDNPWTRNATPVNNWVNTNNLISKAIGNTQTRTTTIEAVLNGLSVANQDISPQFDSQTHEYTLDVGHDTEQITITPTAASGVTVTVTPADADPDTTGHQIDLNAAQPGAKPAQTAILITATASSSIDSYTLTVTRAAPPLQDPARQNLSSDATLSALSAGTLTLDPVFASGVSAYAVSVSAHTGWVTVEASPTVEGSGVVISPADANPLVGGHQVELAASPNGRSDGVTSVTVAVTSTDGTTLVTYTVTVSRPPATSFQAIGGARISLYNVSKGVFVAKPKGIWSDGKTIWVAEADYDYTSRPLVYAIDSATGENDWSRAFLLEGRSVFEKYATDAWSDGEMMWVLGRHGRLDAYNLSTRERVRNRDITSTAAYNSFGVWSDGATIWVASNNRGSSGIRAADLSTGERLPDKDIAIPPGGNAHQGAADIWSDGKTMWVMYTRDNVVRAYDLDSGERRTDIEIDILSSLGVRNPRGLWSDGGTMWVTRATSDEHNALIPLYLPTVALVETLTVDGADIGTFDPWQTAYTAIVDNATTTLTLNAAAYHPDASITIVPADTDDTTAGHQINLNPGTNTTTVTAGTRNHTITYTITVIRQSLTEPRLQGIAVAGNDISPQFNPETRQYTLDVGHDTEQITVTPTAESGVTVTVTPADADPGTAGHQINLNATEPRGDPAQTAITITITADGHTVSYTLTVTRQVPPPSDTPSEDLQSLFALPITMSLPSGCEWRDFGSHMAKEWGDTVGSATPVRHSNGNILIAGYHSSRTLEVANNEWNRWEEDCLSLHFHQQTRGGHYYRLYVREPSTVWMKVMGNTTTRLIIRSASGTRLHSSVRQDYGRRFNAELSTRLERGVYVVEVVSEYQFGYAGRQIQYLLEFEGEGVATREALPLWDLEISGVDMTAFDPGITFYRREVADDVSMVTVTASPVFSDASVVISPADADAATEGHQVTLDSEGQTKITVTLSDSDSSDTNSVYTVWLTSVS